MHIFHIVGTRPNFVKAAPVMAALSRHGGIHQTLVHTGQHYDANMSGTFFQQLGMPSPDVDLEVGSVSPAQQVAQIISRLEVVVREHLPDLVLIYGDVNSTMAAAQVCGKLGIRLGHVEAGLRSRDRSMPEEMNRLVADQLSDLLFTPSVDADENLCQEGFASSKIHRVGNVMIDTLVRMLPRCDDYKLAGVPDRYILVTLHRPSNVDDPECLLDLLNALTELADEIKLPFLFPVHPRTRQRIAKLEFDTASGGIRFLNPAAYLTFLALQKNAALVLTDSGGVQEETSFLGIPCLTLRDNTERPITTTLGTNVVIGSDVPKMRQEALKALSRQPHVPMAIPLWDGHAAERIANIIVASVC
jgi:UDP-N-acetylglucosamine 2-epimerase (non-hydrolysing)